MRGRDPATGRQVTAVDRTVRGKYTVSRADVADTMLRALTAPGTIRHALGVAGP